MERTHSFKITTSKIKGQEYKMEIPTAGQLIAIERAKANLTGGDYGKILANNTIGSNYALDVVDMTAYLNVLCPQLFNDLKVESLMDLDIFDMKQLQEVWNNDCVTWIQSWQTVLRETPKTKAKKSAGKEGDNEESNTED